MFRRVAITTARTARVASATRAYATTNAKHVESKTRQRNPLLLAAVAGVAVGGFAMTDLVHAKEAKPDLDAIRKDIVAIFDKNNYMGPTFVRLAWHAAGTYKLEDGSGGSDGGTIRTTPELYHGGNAGLHHAVKALEHVKEKHPEITYADLYILAGVTMIEEMGGPKVKFHLGRVDSTDPKYMTPDDRLPNADMGCPRKNTQHVRDVFYRMGFNDREIVALLGCHAIGRCYPERSGYSGPWTNSEWTFSNEFFRELLENTWTKKQWNGPEQYEDKSKSLMMLPADMVLLTDPEFKKYVELYAKDEEIFFKDFSAAFQKLTELGCANLEKTGWKKYIFFGPRGD